MDLCHSLGRTNLPALLACVALTVAVNSASASVAAEPAATGPRPTSESTPAWQQKLDPALRAAAERFPDRVLQIVIHTAAGERRAKAQSLAAAGFEVHPSRTPGGILVSATVQEAMVLAEDPDIERIVLAEAPDALP